MQLPKRNKKNVTTKEVTLNENKKECLICCCVCSYRPNMGLYFYTSYEGIEEIVQAARR